MCTKQLLSVIPLLAIVSVRAGLLDDITQRKDLAGKKILVEINKAFPEVPCMGLGDQFQFYGPYVEYLEQQGAEVVTTVSKSLKTLFAKSSSINQEVDQKYKYEKIELADLFTALTNKVPNFKRISPVLQCPVDLVIKAHNLIRSKTRDKEMPVIFFTSGNVVHNTDRFPKTEDWNSLTDNVPGVHFFNCQFKGDDIKNSTRPSELTDSFDKEPFMDTMAFIVAAVTLNKGITISPDTGTLHLAASALEGKPDIKDAVWCPLPQEPDQRWKDEYTTLIEEVDHVQIKKSDYYPKSVRIYQQCKKGDWSFVIKAMKNDLKKRAKVTYSNN